MASRLSVSPQSHDLLLSAPMSFKVGCVCTDIEVAAHALIGPVQLGAGGEFISGKPHVA